MTGTLLAFLRTEGPVQLSQRRLTFEERVSYQRAIEEVYWRHRIWPKERPDPKPSLDAVMSQAQLENKVEDYLRESEELEDHWQRPITAEDLQAEMDRIAQHTKQPEVLRELFEALGNDPFLIVECLAKPVLSERLVAISMRRTKMHRELRPRAKSWKGNGNNQREDHDSASANYVLPTISDAATGCTPDTWTNTSTTNAPSTREAGTAVWTGSEMIIWGGRHANDFVDTGGRYNPSTDSWVATSRTNAPAGRLDHTAVWTGSEMIIWGGWVKANAFNTGGRYNPGTDSWTATSITNAPEARYQHTAVWTGSEMIVWGGYNGSSQLNTAGGTIPVPIVGPPPAPRTHQMRGVLYHRLDAYRDDYLGWI